MEVVRIDLDIVSHHISILAAFHPLVDVGIIILFIYELITQMSTTLTNPLEILIESEQYLFIN